MRDISFNFVIVRNGADYGLLAPAKDSAPSIRMSADGEIKTSFSGEFLPTVLGFDNKPDPDLAVDWLSDQIRPELVIDGIPHSLGVYLPTTVTENHDELGTGLVSYDVEAYDRCWIVKSTIPTSVFFAANVSYLTAIEALLTACGIALISATPTTAKFTEARADWQIGTDSLTIISQLLSEINYNPLWFDPDGTAILEPASTPTAANIEHTLDAKDPDTLIRAGLQKTMDFYNTPNVFLCVCNNADKSGIMTATAENTNPQSPLSVARRGRRITKVVNVDNIASQSELRAYADRLCWESMFTSEVIEVQTGLLPGFGVKDVVAIDYGDTFEVCIEKAWTMDLQPGGRMNHTLEKVVLNFG